MAKRMSNRERIERLALENAAADAEKKAKKEAAPKKTATKKKSTATARRQKIVWQVVDSSFKEVAVFLYPEKDKAEADAEKRTKKTGNAHFVQRSEVPMEDS